MGRYTYCYEIISPLIRIFVHNQSNDTPGVIPCNSLPFEILRRRRRSFCEHLGPERIRVCQRSTSIVEARRRVEGENPTVDSERRQRQSLTVEGALFS